MEMIIKMDAPLKPKLESWLPLKNLTAVSDNNE